MFMTLLILGFTPYLEGPGLVVFSREILKLVKYEINLHTIKMSHNKSNIGIFTDMFFGGKCIYFLQASQKTIKTLTYM
jgi:hypothetical protein